MMNLIFQRRFEATENDKFIYAIYRIEGFNKDNTPLLVQAICSNMGPMVEIIIRFTSDDAERVEPLVFNNYNDFICGLNSFVFANVDFLSIYYEEILISINFMLSTLTVSTANPDLEEQFINDVSVALSGQNYIERSMRFIAHGYYTYKHSVQYWFHYESSSTNEGAINLIHTLNFKGYQINDYDIYFRDERYIVTPPPKSGQGIDKLLQDVARYTLEDTWMEMETISFSTIVNNKDARFDIYPGEPGSPRGSIAITVGVGETSAERGGTDESVCPNGMKSESKNKTGGCAPIIYISLFLILVLSFFLSECSYALHKANGFS